MCGLTGVVGFRCQAHRPQSTCTCRDTSRNDRNGLNFWSRNNHWVPASNSRTSSTSGRKTRPSIQVVGVPVAPRAFYKRTAVCDSRERVRRQIYAPENAVRSCTPASSARDIQGPLAKDSCRLNSAWCICQNRPWRWAHSAAIAAGTTCSCCRNANWWKTAATRKRYL